jgi:hypothetical protein
VKESPVQGKKGPKNGSPNGKAGKKKKNGKNKSNELGWGESQDEDAWADGKRTNVPSSREN